MSLCWNLSTAETTPVSRLMSHKCGRSMSSSATCSSCLHTFKHSIVGCGPDKWRVSSQRRTIRGLKNLCFKVVFLAQLENTTPARTGGGAVDFDLLLAVSVQDHYR